MASSTAKAKAGSVGGSTSTLTTTRAPATAPPRREMSDAAVNEAVAHPWHMELFQEGKLELAEEILLPDFVFHALEDGKGVEAARQLATDFRAVFPDLTITDEDTVAAGDKVPIRWTAGGTHHGELLLGVPATGKEIGSGGLTSSTCVTARLPRCGSSGTFWTLIFQPISVEPRRFDRFAD